MLKNICVHKCVSTNIRIIFSSTSNSVFIINNPNSASILFNERAPFTHFAGVRSLENAPFHFTLLE